ncbi:(1-_4)-alpha-D-glucan 1-alpha-D-glucosylmutase [Nocardiopsis mwathae]|uniref:(1->4)-alpha-D-glucan 1-alpha-D-glucosylmutase n=1 Tax=Nocardiopsis mwathae TaxID=1472723 RepID=A0A7W9YH23_9ACTN|nr:malto-oligosyltrehalose synthase [Nocardiopsis mwathae]MBB6172013.1 (1->4)-alpha-D-glucan 1-alpha-D-glucosylmutase [Nocardiopsis mwathae]
MGTLASTYRLQLGPGRTFADAADLADYLHRLGVGAVYVSPILAAAPGSPHGYDVVDPARVSAELGGEEGRAALVDRLRRLGLGLVVDIVPNHMSVAVPAANPWWWDVLRLGPGSPYARCFDIDWASGPLPLPVLPDDGDDGAAALGGLTVVDDCLSCADQRFPLAPGTFAPGDDPGEVHLRQHYRLVSWRRAATDLRYRRFFDISGLAAVRVEDPDVFTATHARILGWAERGEVDGLRVDHVDGLSDPGGYLRRLRDAFGGWIVVEKILAPGETPPASWPVGGTTGYDALREVGGLFIDPAAERPLTELADALGVPADTGAVEARCRYEAAATLLQPEVRRIAALLGDTAEAARGAGDDHAATVASAEEAVAELLARFPCYRSYLPEREADWALAVDRARRARPDLVGELDRIDARVRADPRGELARRIQQTSGAVVAKGTEDTACYRATRFIALNEVGGAPDRFGTGPAEFHTAAARREASWPSAMTTLSTHDTKRSEDVRARLAALTEIPEDFAAAVRDWTARCGLGEPSLNLLAWQTLVGAWPISAARLRCYLLKAAREAKLRTSWLHPDPAFEAEVGSWPERVLSDAPLAADVAALVGRIRAAGWSNALGQKLVQLTAPGVPDVYQGTELWDLSLVDPDNRRPVDFATRTMILERLESGWLPPVDAAGAVKLHVVRQALLLRRGHPMRGYRPLGPTGPAADHAVAFARGPGLDAVTIATRLPLRLAAAGGWRTTSVPLPGGPGLWRDLLTGRDLAPERTDGFTAARLADVLDPYPVALLVRRTDDAEADRR